MVKHIYRDKMIVTRNIGKQTIITFQERSHEILKENWKIQKMSESEEKKVIIQTAAPYIWDSIRSRPYPISTYPCMSDISQESVDNQIPEDLKLFLDEFIKSKPENELPERIM